MLSEVALLAEGVDRNNRDVQRIIDSRESPSSRRAWIEIRTSSMRRWAVTVALLAEGVDRNTKVTE